MSNPIDHGELKLRFASAVYSLDAVKKAAYVFGDRCYAHIEVCNDVTVVTLQPKGQLPGEQLSGEFANEVLDQDLRQRIAAETEGIRNLIIAQAFSSASLLNPALDGADFRDDPLGIAIPDDATRRQRP